MPKRNSTSAPASPHPATTWPLDRTLFAVIACVVAVIAVAIRIRLLGVPLERDEGEYAYTGQLMLQGIAPYKFAYSMKFPGTAAAYALIMSIFGQTITGIHLGLLLVNIATIALMWVLGRRLLDETAGYAAAASYAVLSLTPSMLGLASHATHFVLLPVLAGILLLLNRSKTSGFLRLFVAGLLFGVGLLMKQPAIFFIPFAALYILFRDIRDRLDLKAMSLRMLIFGGGVLLPFATTCLLLWRAGVFGTFWFWTIDYARQYAGETSLPEARREFIPTVIGSIGASWPLWVMAGIGLAALLRDKRARPNMFFLGSLLVFSILAVSYRLYLRNHYFILLLPAVSLLVGIAVSKLRHFSHPNLARLVPMLTLCAALGWPIYHSRSIFFNLSPVQVCQAIYPGNPFVESVRVAQYLQSRTTPSDQIAVLGSEPEIYFYAHRHSATGYIYTYGLVEGQPYAVQMQRELVKEVELSRPQYFVVVGVGGSWLAHPGVQHPIFNWITDYTRQNYDLVGFVNMLGPGRTDYYFDDLPTSLPAIGNRIFVDRKKS
jgi:Dolichyl-phosphate-mannose-protein mannosyltransferase